MMMAQPIDSGHTDLANQRIKGYKSATNADRTNPDSTASAGTCAGATACGDDILGTHIAALIAGESRNGGVQGIAYNAKIKPIHLNPSDLAFDSSIDALALAAREPFAVIARANRAKAIEEASIVDFATCDGLATDALKMASPACKPITVMNNNWQLERYNLTYMGDSYLVSHSFRIGGNGIIHSISPAEIAAWTKAAKNTVMVFAAGDYGQNSINGVVKLYMDDTFAERATNADGTEKEVAWKTVFPTNSNISGSYNNLTKPGDAVVPEMIGKILAVIALDRDSNGEEVIHKYSNGCGIVYQDSCISAPGTAINSAIPGTGSTAYKVESGTAQAAAHVSGAVAVLKGAFPNLTPEQLVSVILNTADYIKENDADTKTDGTNRVYGHGALNLARATDPIGSLMITDPNAASLAAGVTIDNSGITLPTSFGGALDGFTTGFIDDYKPRVCRSPCTNHTAECRVHISRHNRNMGIARIAKHRA